MGLVRAAVDSAGGTLADQWKDFLTVPGDIRTTAALFPAVRAGTNANRGSNVSASESVITHGSKIVVPEGYGLLLLEEGAITGFTDEPGGYTWDSDSLYSESIFAGDSPWSSLVQQSWNRFKFGGRPGAQQIALFVRMRELPDNKFGTQSVVYWDDAYFNAQVGAIAHGTFSLHIEDPILFVARYVPATFLQGQGIFDFTDRNNPAASQLLAEVVGSLSAAFSRYTNDSDKGHRITTIQRDALGFAHALSETVQEAYGWREKRGLAMSQATIMGIGYDPATQELLQTVQRADALAGSRGNVNLQASLAEGIQQAGSQGGSEGILGIGLAAGSVGLAGMMQQEPSTSRGAGGGPAEDDLIATLTQLKQALDAGLITEQEFDDAKAKALGLA